MAFGPIPHLPLDRLCPQPPARPVQKGKAGGSGGAFYGDALERELAAVGLRVQKITADGNCMFRAVGDQTEVGSLFNPAANLSLRHSASRRGPCSCRCAWRLPPPH